MSGNREILAARQYLVQFTPHAPWQWFTLGGFIAFATSVFSVIYYQDTQVAALAASRPQLSIREFIGDDDVGIPRGYLEVENLGGNAQVPGIGAIVNGRLASDRWSKPCDMPWRWQLGGRLVDLQQAGKKVIGLGARVTHPISSDPDGFPWVIEFEIWSGNQVSNIRVPWRSTSPGELCIFGI